MKVVLVVFCIVTLCSMALALANTATVSAYKAGYGITSYNAQITPTYDGMVSPAEEWSDCFKDRLYSGWTMTDSIFGCKWTYGETVYENWVIEFLSDNTNDTGDYWQLCYDGNGDGGAAPKTDDVRIDYTGHSRTATLTIYIGTGTGWAPTTAYAYPANIEIAESLSASPASATPHWIVEIKFDKTPTSGGVSMLQDTWIRVAAYDANADGAGLLVWPPTSSRDVPNHWGLNAAVTDGSTTTDGSIIPEGLTVGFMVLLSSVAVIVSARYFHKRP